MGARRSVVVVAARVVDVVGDDLAALVLAGPPHAPASKINTEVATAAATRRPPTWAFIQSDAIRAGRRGG
jgi:hypothetical protein